MLSKATLISRAVPGVNNSICRPMAVAAARTSAIADSAVGFLASSSMPKRGHAPGIRLRHALVEIADYRHRRLLRARHSRPGDRRTGERREKIVPAGTL